jgi:hypothetical protein
MTQKKRDFWQRMGLHNWFLKKEAEIVNEKAPVITPDDVYKYILDKFEESIAELSFAKRIVFFHEYIICFNPEDFKLFQENKKGLFGLIIHESVKQFYSILKEYRQKGYTVEPSSNKWAFRFVSHPDYARGDKSFIGKLLPGSSPQKEENLRVTFIPRQTGVSQTFDINQDILDGFTFYSEGYYEVPYHHSFKYEEGNITHEEHAALARFETIIPDKEYAGRKVEYFMKAPEIIVSGKDESKEQPNIFRIPSEWVNTPHLKIKFNKAENKFYVASFGEKTMVNEIDVTLSNAEEPLWVQLPLNSKMVLNGIVGINIYKP